MNHYNYAVLGNSCQTDLSVLTSSTKFIKPGNSVYDIKLTKMDHYPGQVYEFSHDLGIGRPEDIKIKKSSNDVGEPYGSSCCGKR
jgi:hypothetical protein